MKQLTIIGASGHGKVVADIARLIGYDKITFLDDDPRVAECGGHPVAGTSADVARITGEAFVAVGNTEVRRRLMDANPGLSYATLVHPSAVVARDACLGAGTVVMAGAVINPAVKVGRGCIVNTCASVDHDCAVGDFCHVSVGARLCGTVTLGDGVWVGAGATVINNVSICPGCTIGAGAVVVRNIAEPGTYVGVPASIVGLGDNRPK